MGRLVGRQIGRLIAVWKSYMWTPGSSYMEHCYDGRKRHRVALSLHSSWEYLESNFPSIMFPARYSLIITPFSNGEPIDKGLAVLLRAPFAFYNASFVKQLYSGNALDTSFSGRGESYHVVFFDIDIEYLSSQERLLRILFSNTKE